MKNLIIIVSLVVVFIIGVNVSDMTINQNQIFENEKNQFEENITTPGNEYESKELVPDRNIVSKTANFFEESIEKVIEKAKDMLKKL